MKALVLAGGAGTRLRPLTHTSAKQLVPIANKPILFYGLEQIAAAGITHVGIIVGDTRAEIRSAVGDGSAFGLEVSYIHQDRPLGLAHAVLIARDFLGDDDFVMFLGDNLIEGGIHDLLVDFDRSRSDARILLKKVDDPRRFGVVEVTADGAVERLVEKPTRPRSDFALVGVYLFTSRIFEAAAAIRPSARGELEITDAIQLLVDRGRDVRATFVTGWWLDTGKKDDLLAANQIVLAGIESRIDGDVDADSSIVGEVVLGPGARLARSHVVGPVVIGPGAQVSDSRIGPSTSIAARCVIERSDLDCCVLLEDCRVTGVRMERSVLGREVHVSRMGARRTGTGSGAHRLLLGDHSRLEIAEA